VITDYVDQISNTVAVERILATNNIIETSTSAGTKPDLNDPLNLDTTFANDIQATYYPVSYFPVLTTDLERPPAINNAIQQAALNKNVAGAILLNEGEVDFGRPIAFTAKEKLLRVEPSLDRRYDIYWIELAFSPSEELLQNTLELRYDIKILDSDATVLDLVPMRFGVEASQKNTIEVEGKGTVTSPMVKDVGVEVGEMFSRTIEYKYLRPTIVSYGLLTPSFGWSFKDESLDASAKRMFAVVGLPKGTKQVNTAITVEVKCKKSIWIAAEWATTGPNPYTISLPQ
jgi:hypothetical protein